MKPKIALAASLIAACSLAFSAQAAPPEGKGPGNNAAKQGQGNPNKAKGNPGNNGKGNPGKGNNAKPEKRSNFNDDSRGGRDRSPNMVQSGVMKTAIAHLKNVMIMIVAMMIVAVIVITLMTVEIAEAIYVLVMWLEV